MDDAEYMRRALRLARRGEGYVEPNPMVGCVIVKGGRIVGEGWHRRFGGPHAEVEALRRAGAEAAGATVYVTLEPCPHRGKTPPCAGALVDAGVKRVVIGRADPTPGRVGVGMKRMEAAGIKVEMSPLSDRAARLIEPFVKRVTAGLPFVIAKWAATIDGAMATRTGHSRWISNERSRTLVHRVRGRVDAIVAGIGTVLADDPQLTARGVKLRRTARRIVIDPNLRMPMDGKLMRTLDEAPLTVAVSERLLAASGRSSDLKTLRGAGVEVVGLPPRGEAGVLDLRPLMAHLVEEHHATNVLLEGGGKTIGAFIEQGLVDELMVFVAPKLLGDPHHVPPVVFTDAAKRMDESRSARLAAVRRSGEDVLLRYWL